MASATDTPRGKVFLFEDFLYDVAPDKPEYAVDTDPAVEIVAGTGGNGGVMRVTMDGAQTDIGGIGFGTLQWELPIEDGEGHLIFEARVKLSAVGTAVERIFIGFTDVQEGTLTEMPFTIAGTTITAVTNPDDAVGFIWEGDATNASWYPASQNSDSLVVDGTTNVAVVDRVGPVATEWQTLKIDIGPGAKVAEFSVDGKVMYRYTGTATVTADVFLMPIIVVTEGTTAINFDIDYVHIESKRQA